MILDRRLRTMLAVAEQERLTQLPPDRVAEENQIKEVVHTLLRLRISPRCEYCLRSYYGIGRREMTLPELAKDFEVTPQAVRQMANKGMRDIRKYLRRMGYLDEVAGLLK